MDEEHGPADGPDEGARTGDGPAADPLAWETLGRETGYTCEGFDVVTDAVRFPGGDEGEYDYLVEGESVVILPFTADGEVVVIEEWRQAVGRVNRGLPAGGVEDGEAPRAAVDRELAEETGYEAGAVEHLASVEPANGFSDAVFHYFRAEDCSPTADRDLDYNESIRVDTADFDALVAAVREGRLRDGRTTLAVLYHALFGA